MSKRDKTKIEARKDFVKMAITDNQQAAKELKRIARKIERAKSTTETIDVLTESTFLTKRTLWNDLIS